MKCLTFFYHHTVIVGLEMYRKCYVIFSLRHQRMQWPLLVLELCQPAFRLHSIQFSRNSRFPHCLHTNKNLQLTSNSQIDFVGRRVFKKSLVESEHLNWWTFLNSIENACHSDLNLIAFFWFKCTNEFRVYRNAETFACPYDWQHNTTFVVGGLIYTEESRDRIYFEGKFWRESIWNPTMVALNAVVHVRPLLWVDEEF